MQPQTQMVYVGQPQTANHYNVERSLMRVSGIIQLIAGLGLVLCNIIFIAVLTGGYSAIGLTGPGFWGGIPFIITGAVGIAAGNGNRCLVIAYLVLCIISTIIGVICVIMWGLSMIVIQVFFANGLAAVGVMIIFSLLLSLMEVAGAITGSVSCCRGMGASPQTVAVPVGSPGNVQVMTTSTATYPAQQQYGYPPQGGAYPSQGGAYPSQGEAYRPAAAYPEKS